MTLDTGYDEGVVSRDLQKLADIDVVEYVEGAVRKRRGSSTITSLSSQSSGWILDVLRDSLR